MKVADYVLRAKTALGDPHMSDRAFGERFGVTASTISNARYYGKLSDDLALELSVLLRVDAGEIMLVSKAEREKDGPVKDALLAYAKKVIASVPKRATAAVAAGAVALSMLFPAPNAEAAGGSGEIRTHGRVTPSAVFKFTVELNRNNGLADFRLRNLSQTSVGACPVGSDSGAQLRRTFPCPFGQVRLRGGAMRRPEFSQRGWPHVLVQCGPRRTSPLRHVADAEAEVLVGSDCLGLCDTCPQVLAIRRSVVRAGQMSHNPKHNRTLANGRFSANNASDSMFYDSLVAQVGHQWAVCE